VFDFFYRLLRADVFDDLFFEIDKKLVPLGFFPCIAALKERNLETNWPIHKAFERTILHVICRHTGTINQCQTLSMGPNDWEMKMATT